MSATCARPRVVTAISVTWVRRGPRRQMSEPAGTSSSVRHGAMRTASPIPGLGSTTQEGALDEPDRYLVSASPTRSARGRLTCDGYRTEEPPHPAELPSGAVSCLVAGSGSRNTTCLGDFAPAAYAGPEAGARGAWRSSSQPFDRAVSPRPPGPHLGGAARLRRTSPFAQLRAGSPNSRRLCLRQAYPRRAREPAPPGVSPSRSSGAGWAGSTSVTSTRSCRTADAEPPARVARIAARARAPLIRGASPTRANRERTTGRNPDRDSSLFAQLGSSRWQRAPDVRTVDDLTPTNARAFPDRVWTHRPRDPGTENRPTRSPYPGGADLVWRADETKASLLPSNVGNRRSDDGPCR